MKIYMWAIVVLAVVYVGNYFGNAAGLYVTFDGYDIFMHIAGGLGIGLLVAAFLERNAPLEYRSRRMIILCVLLAGIIWELFEAYFNIAGAPVGTKLYWIDTVKDLIDDCLGGLIIAVIRKRYWVK